MAEEVQVACCWALLCIRWVLVEVILDPADRRSSLGTELALQADMAVGSVQSAWSDKVVELAVA